jgi:density-regulated protein DRP1
MAVKLQPLEVLYCPVCSLPAEYCEFGPDFEKCKPWLIKNAPELYPDLVKEAAEKTTEQLEGLDISCEKDLTQTQGTTSDVKKDEEVKRLPGGKVKKKEKPEVIVEKIVRNKRKCVTIIKGLDMFGIKLSDASKKLGKKFASGASVVKGPTEKDQIDVQGDIMYDLAEFITETWQNVGSLSSTHLVPCPLLFCRRL